MFNISYKVELQASNRFNSYLSSTFDDVQISNNLNMLKKKRLTRRICGVSFSAINYKFLSKVENEKKRISKVNSIYPCYKICHECRLVNKTIPLIERELICKQCKNNDARRNEAAIRLKERIEALASDPCFKFKPINMVGLVEQLSLNEQA